MILDAPAQPQENTLPVVCAIQELWLGKTKAPGKWSIKVALERERERQRETVVTRERMSITDIASAWNFPIAILANLWPFGVHSSRAGSSCELLLVGDDASP